MAHHRQLLVAESDERARITLASELSERLDCSTTDADCAEAVRDLVRRGTRLDAVLLAAKLRDGDGRELCRELRAGGLGVPILMLATSARETDVVWALDAGASDYVVVPYRTAELAARLRAQLRAYDTSEYAEVPIGPFVFRPGTRTLSPVAGGRPTRLTDKEAALLKHLYRACGQPVSRETLLREVWGYRAEASTHTVETHIYRLRRKIETPDAASPLVASEGGSYRLALGEARAPRWPRLRTNVAVFARAAGAD